MRKRPHAAAAEAQAAARRPSAASSAQHSSLSVPSAPLSLLPLRACRSLPPGSVVSFLCVLVSADRPELITRRDGSRVCVCRWLVSDPSCSYLRLTLWGAQATDAASTMRVGQILLAQSFEVHSFRQVISLESKAKSNIRVMDERNTADAVDTTSRGTASGDRKKLRVSGATGSLASHSSEFRSASASLAPFTLASSLSNWHEMCTAADALRQWARRDNGLAMLGQPRFEQAPAAPSTSMQAGSSTASCSSSLVLTPLPSLPSVDANELVSVSGLLRCVRQLPSTRGSSAPAAASTSVHASAPSADSGPPHSLFCVLSFRDPCGFESLVELELRCAEWRSRAKQAFWSAAQGRTIVVQHVRVTWSAHADAHVLHDASETGITIAEDAAQATVKAVGADSSASSPVSASPELRGHLIAIRFPLLTIDLLAKLLSYLRSTVAAASSVSRLPTLPADVFSALFYTGCVSCLSPVSPDDNGVYECAICFRSMRYSQEQARVDGAAQVAVLYRDVQLTIQPAREPSVAAPALCVPSSAASSPSTVPLRPSELIASHFPLRDLLGNIDPQTLIDTAEQSSQPMHEASSAVTPPSAGHAATPTTESLGNCGKQTMDRLLRLQWSQLMLLLPIVAAVANSLDEPSAVAPLAAPLFVTARLCENGLGSVAEFTSDAEPRVSRTQHVGRLDLWP